MARHVSWILVAVLMYDRVGTVNCVCDLKMHPAVGNNNLLTFSSVSTSSLEYGVVVTMMSAGQKTVLLRVVAPPGYCVVLHGTAGIALPRPLANVFGGNTTDTCARCGVDIG